MTREWRLGFFVIKLPDATDFEPEELAEGVSSDTGALVT